MDKITYIISSKDDVNQNTDACNNCNIRISDLPNKFSHYKVKVKSFIINQGTIDATWRPLHYIHLISDNFINQNQIVSGSRIPNVLAICNLSNGQITNIDNQFIMKNINGTVLNFRLVDEYFDLVQDAVINDTEITCWTLILEIEGIN